MDGHPWTAYVAPMLNLAAFAACVRYRRLAPHMLWLVFGFGAFCVDMLAPWVFYVDWLRHSAVGRALWDVYARTGATVYEGARVFVIIGLVTVLGDLRARLSVGGNREQQGTHGRRGSGGIGQAG